MTARPRSAGTRGAALLLALLVLIAGSAAVLLGFTDALLQWRAGRGTSGVERAHAAAETGLAMVESGWSPAYDTLPRGQLLALAPLSLGGGDSTRITILPLSGSVYRLTAIGRHITPVGTASAILATYLRIDAPYPEILAALSVLDTAVVDNASLLGNDSMPSTWAGRCSPPGPPRAGLRVGAATVWGACPGCAGAPPVAQDSALSPAVFNRFGPDTYAGLAARALRVATGTLTGLGPVVVGGLCLQSDSTNWGEPLGSGPATACREFFPVVHAPGNLRLDGGRGQGVLLVDGDLELTGGVAYTGVVVVRGSLRATGLGGRITGGVLAAQADLGPGSGPLTVQYSSCALRRALRAAGLPAPLPGWRWAELY